VAWRETSQLPSLRLMFLMFPMFLVLLIVLMFLAFLMVLLFMRIVPAFQSPSQSPQQSRFWHKPKCVPAKRKLNSEHWKSEVGSQKSEVGSQKLDKFDGVNILTEINVSRETERQRNWMRMNH
jgi:hypothetical protein